MPAEKPGVAPLPANLVDWDDDGTFGELDLAPVPMRIGGHIYRVRRDLTPAEVRKAATLAATKDDAGFFGVIVGDPAAGDQLNTTLDNLPAAKSKVIIRRIAATTGAFDEDGRSGEA